MPSTGRRVRPVHVSGVGGPALLAKFALIAKAAAIDGGGQVMLLAAATIAYLQDQGGPIAGEAGARLAEALIQALAAGGVLYILVQKLLTEWGKREDAKREAQKEERGEEREERERFFQHWVGRITDLNKANADLVQRYIERELRYEEQYRTQLGMWQKLCDSERERSERLVERLTVQFVEKQTVINTPATPPAATGPG